MIGRRKDEFSFNVVVAWVRLNATIFIRLLAGRYVSKKIGLVETPAAVYAIKNPWGIGHLIFMAVTERTVPVVHWHNIRTRLQVTLFLKVHCRLLRHRLRARICFHRIPLMLNQRHLWLQWAHKHSSGMWSVMSHILRGVPLQSGL